MFWKFQRTNWQEKKTNFLFIKKSCLRKVSSFSSRTIVPRANWSNSERDGPSRSIESRIKRDTRKNRAKYSREELSVPPGKSRAPWKVWKVGSCVCKNYCYSRNKGGGPARRYAPARVLCTRQLVVCRQQRFQRIKAGSLNNRSSERFYGHFYGACPAVYWAWAAAARYVQRE